MRPFEFLQEPAGSAWDALLDFSLAHCAAFSVSESEFMGWDALEELAMSDPEQDEWSRRNQDSRRNNRKYVRVTRETIEVLRDCGGLYRCPDDLEMHVADGRALFECIAHEGMGWFDPTVLPENIVRPLMEQLHAQNVAPPPDATRRYPPYMFPGLGLDELKAIWSDGVQGLTAPGAVITRHDLGVLQDEMRREGAFQEYWGHRLCAGELPSEEDFRAAGARGYNLGDVLGGAAAIGMLETTQAESLVEAVPAGWARGQILGFLWLERLRDACSRGSEAEEAALISELWALLDTPLQERSVESIYDPNGSGTSWLLFRAVERASAHGTSRLEELVAKHGRLSEHVKTQFKRALDARQKTLSGSG